jgi:hypothetical protein
MSLLADISLGMMAGATIVPLVAAAGLWMMLVRSEKPKPATNRLDTARNAR